MLVLADADRLRVDLHQLGQRVLEPARDRHRAAQGHVQLGQLLRGVRRRRVHRRAGLGYDHLGGLELGEPGEQVGGQLVGLPGGGAVADRDQLHLVPGAQRGQRRDRLVPLARRYVRVDRRRLDHLAGGIDHGHLDPGTEARVQTHRRAGTGRSRQQQVPQVRGEHPYRLVLGQLEQPGPQVDAQVPEDAGTPGPAHRVRQPLVARAAPVADPEAPGDRRLVRGGVPVLGWLQHQVEDLLLLAPEQRQDPVRGQLGQRLGEVEVVAELRAVLLPTVAYLRHQPAPRPHPLAQLADQVGVLGEALDQDRPGTVQRGRHVGDAPLGVHERGRRRLRVHRRVVQQAVGERLQAGLPRDLRLGPALRFVRQVDVLQPGLRVGLRDPGRQLVVELALGADRFEDGGPPLVQLAQVPQAFLQGAQLGVVERAGRLLPVPGDEGHGGPAVEQVDGRTDLVFPDAELGGDALLDGDCHAEHSAGSPTGGQVPGVRVAVSHPGKRRPRPAPGAVRPPRTHRPCNVQWVAQVHGVAHRYQPADPSGTASMCTLNNSGQRLTGETVPRAGFRAPGRLPLPPDVGVTFRDNEAASPVAASFFCLRVPGSQP